MDEDLILPRARARAIGMAALEKDLRAAMDEGVLSHGWIIAGPPGVGKATLAYRIARGLLSPEALTTPECFDVDPEAQVSRFVAAAAHPDLFVAERLWDEKKAKHQSEITVDTIRKLTAFLHRTASGGGARVAIVDIADNLNRNAANALLKVLEEPPSGAMLMLLSASPGRLLPTIRSRCRTVTVPTLADSDVEAFLLSEGVDAEVARTVAGHARGRPGYALSLAAEGGADAIGLAQNFLKAAAAGRNVTKIAAALTGKAGEARWPIFRDCVVATLSDSARIAASGGEPSIFPEGDAAVLLEAWESVSQLISRGDALNLDRGQLIAAIAHDLRGAMTKRAA